LIDQIKSDQKTRVKLEEPLSINISSVTGNPDQSTTGLNGHFVHSLLLIDVLLRMKSVQTDKKQLISLCQNEYKNNPTDLSFVREFDKDYSSDKALWWYTRELFLYKMLNKALRIQNIDLLFLFRFVIGDIYRQLKQYQYQSPIRVYRGQVMSNDELNDLRQSINEYISINSFFSTSTNPKQALGFLNSSSITDDLHRVLFVIDADPCVVTTKPFANVSSESYFGNESEVLFMIGCTFRLIDVGRDDDDQIWMIRMKLCGDDEHELKNLFNHMKKQYGCGEDEVDLRSFGNVLQKMGKFDLAEKMYHRFLKELPPNDPSLSNLYWSLGNVTSDKGNYDMSLQWFHKSLESKMQTHPSDYVNIGGLYNWIGVVYYYQNDNKEALEWYNKAIKLFKQANNENHPHMASFYNNIAIVFERQKKYSEALDFYKKSLAIKEEHLPLDHPEIGGSHNNIGLVHYSLGQYDVAMEHYNQSLKIWLKSLPSRHPNIAISYKNIGGVHNAKGDLKQALTYYEKAAVIYRHSLPPEHANVIQIEQNISNVSMK
jgi:tetratricopeptide (TPR) repeat protein